MKIAVIGTGYVGLVSGACLADFGFNVWCVDKDEEKIKNLQQGKIPIYEPGLEDLVKKNLISRNLHFTTCLEEALKEGNAVFLAVGTPSRSSDGHADLSYIFQAIEEISRNLKSPTVVITKSTVPVGTGREIQARLKALRPDLDVCVASNPEFLREGSAIEDFMHPDRIVIGSEHPQAKKVLQTLYHSFNLLETPIIHTDIETAELIKYAANGFLATKIAFINEIADLCEKCGANIQEVSRGIGLDSRIGEKFLNPGPGYGGACFQKDTLALIKTAEEKGTPITIIEAVVKSNDNRKLNMIKKIQSACKGSLEKKTIGILGVTFKPNTNDMREAPSLIIIPGLQAAGATVQAYDPAESKEMRKYLDDVVWCSDVNSCLKNVDATVILTEWNEFRKIDWQLLKHVVKTPLLIDLRNIYNHEDILSQGFDYVSIGQKTLFIPKLQSKLKVA